MTIPLTLSPCLAPTDNSRDSTRTKATAPNDSCTALASSEKMSGILAGATATLRSIADGRA